MVVGGLTRRRSIPVFRFRTFTAGQTSILKITPFRHASKLDCSKRNANEKYNRVPKMYLVSGGMLLTKTISKIQTSKRKDMFELFRILAYSIYSRTSGTFAETKDFGTSKGRQMKWK